MPELLCPVDRRHPLHIDREISDFNKSFNGVITCRDAHEFPIKSNIIDFLPEAHYPGGSIANFSNHFSITASTYETQWRKRSIGWLSGQDFTLQEEANLLLSWIDPYPKNIVVDIGASTGFYTRTVAKAHSDSSVFAIDFSRPMLEEAIRCGSEDQLQFYPMRADAARLPFFDDQVDVLVCGGTYNELSDPEAVLQEMNRVLKPDGVCFMMYLTKAESFSGKIFQTGLLPGGVFFPKSKKAARQFSQAGFEITKTRSMGIVTFQLLVNTRSG